MTLKEIKQALRRNAAARRAQAARGASADAAVRAAEAFIKEIPIAAGAVVAGYWPIRDEFDVRPLLERLHERQHPCCLPVTGPLGSILTFHRWLPGSHLEIERFGTKVPSSDAEPLRPDVLLVPLLAFDDSGRRLGYGGGYYDRTLAALRATGGALAVGLCFAAQREADVPADDTDAKLDWIVTENGAFRCR